jgi:hypothetical protein
MLNHPDHHAQQYLASTATWAKQQQSQISKLDGDLVEQDIAARRCEARFGYEFAQRVDEIEAALAALRLGLKAISIEINPAYTEEARQRIANEFRLPDVEHALAAD